MLFPFRILGIFWKCARIGERKSPGGFLLCLDGFQYPVCTVAHQTRRGEEEQERRRSIKWTVRSTQRTAEPG
ncbi:unnamed protein product [Oncorhynchus mykiss]|uniref:Uncharacterized protein n=1 Tax=Oncorhynchus mykiss TaxID=8022 RepID=A0A060Z5I5_ONCMY|nr:unnamed protein product [Oncorhynchus mykiss]